MIDLSEFFTDPETLREKRICDALGMRQYQRDALSSSRAGWEQPEVKAQLICLATGCGKTPVMAALARLEIDRGGRVLVLAHTDELIDQALKKIEAFGRIVGRKEKADSYAGRFAKCVVGSVQTMSGRVRLGMWPKDHFTLVLVDEAHRSLAASYQMILAKFQSGGARVIGVTATADRGDKRSLGEFYQRIAIDYALMHAVRDGWLIRPIVKTMPLKIDVNGIKSKSTAHGSDFDQGDVAKRLIPFLGAIAKQVRDARPNGIFMFFMPSVETAELMSAALNEAGIASEWISGDRQERKQIVADFKAGKYRALCNMAVLTEGFDYDRVDTIVCLRLTKIRSLYVQIVGRACRPLDTIVKALNAAPNALERQRLIAASPKPVYTIIDFLWQYSKHDMMKPASLVTEREDVNEKIAGKDGDLMEMEERAERDVLAKLEEQVRKNEHRDSEVIDPLAIAAELGDITIADYQPETKNDALPPTEMQLGKLRVSGIDVSKVKYRGHATELYLRIVRRHEAGLATIRQMNFLATLGIDASQMKREDATALQLRIVSGQGEDIGL